jgi:sensor histidine kinase regulating citrate/malate metabolism/DNA-binding CsgD family transcriptional regulator
MGRSREGSVAHQVLLLQVLVVLLVVVAGVGLAAYDVRQDARDSAVDRAVSVAQTVAESPTVHDALGDPDASEQLQPFTERVRTDTDVDFVVVMDLDRTRYTHTNPAQIGGKFIGDLGGAPEGRVFTQEYTGTLGPSMRAVVPVVVDGDVAALVSVGITIEKIDQALPAALLPVGIAAVAVLAVGLLGALLISRRLRRQTHGLGEQELGRMYEYHRAVLHAVREGLLLLDDQDGVEMANPAAAGWLDELRARRRRLPVVVSAVAQRAREIASGDSGLAATARARTASGRWITVRGWVLQNGTDARTAITLEPARGPELAELLAEAYGLTARERRVSKLVAQGLPNAAIAARLYLSTYTVQDHLKAIFEKLDVSNRGQLVARLFLDPCQRVAGA